MHGFIYVIRISDGAQLGRRAIRGRHITVDVNTELMYMPHGEGVMILKCTMTADTAVIDVIDQLPITADGSRGVGDYSIVCVPGGATRPAHLVLCSWAGTRLVIVDLESRDDKAVRARGAAACQDEDLEVTGLATDAQGSGILLLSRNRDNEACVLPWPLEASQ